ncbi:MAG TPA: glycosyltransferase [Vicinamibacterales bacterium]|nr:glycosyltransferase [Vicinamibacterales bacterium]
MTHRRKVCFVLPSLNGGGAERAAVQILNGLDPQQWDRSMFLFAREGPYLAEVDPSIAIASADTSSRWGRWRALRSFVARERPDVVMAFLSFFSALTAVRAAHTRAKVVFNLQTPMSAFLTDADYHWRRGWHKAAFAAVTRVGYAAADLIIATSQGVARDLTASFGIDPARIRVLANPVDLDRVRAAIGEPIDAAVLPPGDAPLIVAAGRLAEAKNYPLMIDAFAMLRQRIPARLCILGQGELEGGLRQLIQARGLNGSISLAGFQSNPWKYIAQADVFLLTSRYEGFGNVLIEAMACGVPVVATASAGTRDIVQAGTDGVLIEAHTPAAICEVLFRLLSDPAQLDHLRGGAIRSTDRFGLPSTVARYDSTMREAIA